jgi:hypothetical protein
MVCFSLALSLLSSTAAVDQATGLTVAVDSTTARVVDTSGGFGAAMVALVSRVEGERGRHGESAATAAGAGVHGRFSFAPRPRIYAS